MRSTLLDSQVTSASYSRLCRHAPLAFAELELWRLVEVEARSGLVLLCPLGAGDAEAGQVRDDLHLLAHLLLRGLAHLRSRSILDLLQAAEAEAGEQISRLQGGQVLAGPDALHILT